MKKVFYMFREWEIDTDTGKMKKIKSYEGERKTSEGVRNSKRVVKEIKSKREEDDYL